MNFLLDTDIITAFLENNPVVCPHVYRNVGRLSISAISVYEAERWLLRPRSPLHFGHAFLMFQRHVVILNVTEPVAHQAAMLAGQLRRAGSRLPLADLLIAATALEQGLTLVTHGMPQASSIPGLNVVDWLRP